MWTCALPGAEPAKPLSLIAFGSCARQDRPQPIWEAIVAANPELFLFIGDTVYADSNDMDVKRAKYAELKAQPGYRKLQAACPVLATWDDHDFGWNDCGAEYPKKVESQKVFLDAFDEPAESARRKQAGIYTARCFGPEQRRVQVILLDTRYFRSALVPNKNKEPGQGPYLPNPDAKAALLGEEQWTWLAAQLQEPAQVRIVASSIQLVAEEHGWEGWANFPLERERLFKLLAQTRAGGVVFISGDRHTAELSVEAEAAGYRIYDLTSSALNQFRGESREKNRHRIGKVYGKSNFGLLRINWNAADPALTLQICDVEGKAQLEQKVNLSALQPKAGQPK